MKIIPTFLCLFGFTICDILRPNDHFTNINYEEDMGICIGIHSNTTNMTEFEKFQAFKEHNCLPLITLEGVEGTKLQLMITDCDSLSDEVLENCNIMTEKNKHRQYFNILILYRFIWFPPADLVKCKSNVSEFLVWIAFEGDPVSLLGSGVLLNYFNIFVQKCLSALFGAKLSELSSYYGKEPPYILSDQPGIAITWYGNTPDTMNQSNCGINAGEDLGQTDLPLGELMDWQAFYDYTLGMGYQPGLTLLPIPYDWRRQAGNHEATTTLKRSIEFAFKITGKKVVIAGHSFGCLAFLTLMNSFTQEFKDQYIDSFLGLACAWTGSTEAINWALAGENLGWKDIGYPLDDLRNLITSLTSFFDLQPKGIFNASTQWGQAISQRAEQEIEWNSANPAKDIAFPWFPTPENDCYLDRSQDSKCGLHLYDFFKNPVAYAYNDTYMLNESSIIMLMESFMLRTNEEIAFQKLIDGGKVSEEEQNQTWGTKKLIPKDRVSLMMQMVRRNGAQYLKNPGITIHHIYGGHYQTDTWYNISGNPRQYTDKGKTAKSDAMKVNTHWGDHTVNIDNAIVPSLKWAWEYDNGIENAKPVHMIDYCSNYSQLMYKDSTGKYTTQFKNITQNTYNGIMCTNKEHDEFPDDEFIDKYAASLLKSGMPGIPIVNLTEMDINNIVHTCPHIMAPWDYQTFESVYEYGINAKQSINFDYPFSQPSNQFLSFLDNLYSSLEEYQSQVKLQQDNNLNEDKIFLGK